MKTLLVVVVLVLSCAFCVHGLKPFCRSIGNREQLKISSSFLFAGNSAPLDDETREKIDSVIKKNKVVLFMKGNKLFPQCGFSNTACRILDALSTPYETVNVLDDDRIRNGIKVYSSWPTIPQLYVAGEFVGGSDIMIEMYESGELAEQIEIANAS